MTPDERKARGERARHALDEFLDPAFIVVRSEYDARLRERAAVEPWASDRIAALANAMRIVDEVRGQIMSLVHDGEAVRAEMARADRIEKLSPAKRRLLNIGSH